MSVRIINENGECACCHRDLSVCDDCFAATPGLINVYEVVYPFDLSGFDATECAAIRAGTLRGVKVSPGTNAVYGNLVIAS